MSTYFICSTMYSPYTFKCKQGIFIGNAEFVTKSYGIFMIRMRMHMHKRTVILNVWLLCKNNFHYT